jgi:signal transduction histidine kinase
LHHLLQQRLPDTVRVDAQLQLAKFYWYRQPDSAEYYTHRASNLAQKISYRRGEALAYNSMAAIRLLNGEDPGALEYFFKSLAIRQQLNDWKGIASCLNNIGFAYLQQDNISLALEYLHQALAINRKYGYLEGLGYTKNNLGEVKLKSHDYDSAAWYLYGALAMWRQVTNNQGKIITENNIGFIHLENNRIDSARFYFEKAIGAADELQDKRARSRSLIGLASIAQHQKQLTEAIRLAEEAYQTAHQIHEVRYIIQAADLLATAYEQVGDYVNTIKYLKIAAAANDTLLRMEKNNKALALSYEYEKKAAEKELEKELANAKAQRYAIMLLVVGLIGLSLIAVIFWQRSQTANRHNEVLQQSHQQISELNAQLQQTLATAEEQKNAIEEQTRRLKAIDQTKNKLFAIIGHDLQTPINSLYSILLMLDNKEIKPAEMKVLLKHLKNNIKGLSETMENLLAWAKVQMYGQHVQLSNECVNVYETIQLQLQLFAELLKRKKIRVVNRIPETFSVRIEREHLRIVLRNLISNAIKFTHPFGEIVFYVKQEDNHNAATIFVQDNGIGIAVEKQATVFSDIARLSRRGTAGESGSGLGLAFCKELIEKSGGSIGFNSVQGEGSTFYVTLPSICNANEEQQSS